VRGESLALWARHDAPLVALLNDTVHHATNDEPGQCLYRPSGRSMSFFHIYQLILYCVIELSCEQPQ
jgi:hypothetical protein